MTDLPPAYANELVDPTYAGYWLLGGHPRFLLTEKPNAFHRFMITLLLGWEWMDLE